MKTNPLISVVIPTYNRRDLLLEAIDSVLIQDQHAIEIVVVDDGSTDNTASSVTNLDHRIRYFCQTNLGPSAARNLGIEKAQGSFIAFLDSDDLWLPEKLSRDLTIFEKFNEIDCVIGNSQYIKVKNQDIIKHKPELDDKQIFAQQRAPTNFDWSFPLWEKGSLCSTSAMIIKRQCLDKLTPPYFSPELRHAEDWDFELRLYLNCKVVFYPEIVVNGRVFNDGTRLYYACPGSFISEQEQKSRIINRFNILSRYAKKFNNKAATHARVERELSLLSRSIAQ